MSSGVDDSSPPAPEEALAALEQVPGLELFSADYFRSLSPEEREQAISGLSRDAKLALLFNWDFWARPAHFVPPSAKYPKGYWKGQTAPPGDWYVWLYQAGRGVGKTKTGSQTIRKWKEQGVRRMALVGATAADVRDTMVLGESGIIECCPPWDRPRYESTYRRVIWDDGAFAMMYSAEEANRLRGPQHEKAWCLDASTQVSMGNGLQKSISSVKVGDLVATRFGPHRVTASGCTARYVDVVLLVLADGKTLIATPDHQVYTIGRGFLPISDLYEGIILWVRTENSLQNIAAVAKIQKLTEKRDVYNITVEYAHEFFANGILVHNCDELSSWAGDQTWEMLQFGLRLGNKPQILITTTPRANGPNVKLLRKIKRSKNTVISRETTYDNRANLPVTFFTKVISDFEGTRLGQEEIQGEDLEDNPGALWTTTLLNRTRVDCVPSNIDLVKIAVGVDPAGRIGDMALFARGLPSDTSEVVGGDDAGIVVVALGSDGHIYILRDLTTGGNPAKWGRAAVAGYERFQADVIAGEPNHGGKEVEGVIRAVKKGVPFKAINASRGKYIRAQPMATAFERGEAHMVGEHVLLENELVNWVPGSPDSPNRLDAMVIGGTAISADTGLITIDMNPFGSHRW